MTTIIQNTTTFGYKIVHTILQNEYVQLSAQYLTADFMIMALIIESKKILHKIIYHQKNETMNNLKHIEDYFIKLHRSFGISELSYQNRRLELDESNMKQLVFASEAFDEEFENLVDHCSMIYDELQKGFSLKIRKDVNNNYLVNVI